MSFTNFLLSQQHRVDRVGELAAYIAAGGGRLPSGRREQGMYLIDNLKLNLVPALDQAEYDAHTGCERGC